MESDVAIEDIIKNWLKENGYDGLCNCELECGCLLTDFMPCDYPNFKMCLAGYKVDKPSLPSGFDYYLCPSKIGTVT